MAFRFSAILFASLLLSGPALAVDTDGDGLEDIDDNCTLVPNVSQLESDGDGCGNACDADYDQDGTVGGPDFLYFRDAYMSYAGDPEYFEPADHNGDGTIGGPDFLTYRAQDGGVNGPSGLPTRLFPPCHPEP